MVERLSYTESILRTVASIPRGRVATYGEVARAAGNPGKARQVAWALHCAGRRRIPWQRVLGSGGKILLKGESGLHQRLLLELEEVQFSCNRVRMDRHEFHFDRAGRKLASSAG